MSTEKRGGGGESEREAREREREGRMDDREKWVIVYVIVSSCVNLALGKTNITTLPYY